MKNNIRLLRKKESYTQIELAKLLAVSRQTIISIENGRYDPSLTLAFKISEAFNLPIEKIFFKH